MNRRGVAILETVISIVLLGMLLGALFNFLPTSLLTTDRAGHRMQAQAMADSSLEGLRAQPFSELSAGVKTASRRVDKVDYLITVEVFVVPGHDPSRLKGVRTQVAWSDRVGSAQLENEVLLSCVNH